MFDRIREAIRIITYHEPADGPDAVIVERGAETPSKVGKTISRVIEFVVVFYALAYAAGSVGERLSRIIPPTRSVSVATLAGAVGILLVYIVNSIRNDIESRIRARINLAEMLAPYFGHRLDYTIRVLKG